MAIPHSPISSPADAGPRNVLRPPPTRSSRFRLRSSVLWQTADFGARLLLLSAMLVVLSGCSSGKQTPEQRAEAAKALFERATKEFHNPSAEAKGAERLKLQEQAAAAYQELLKEYADQPYWAAQAMRSLGNIRAAQTNVNAAVKLYAEVERKFPQQEWEVCMALKSAADLLWEQGRQPEARPFYEKIVARFDKPDVPQVVKSVVRGSQSRLAGKE